ncbi:hypothetical protein ASO19_07495, partial [Parasaccharibacter apium]
MGLTGLSAPFVVPASLLAAGLHNSPETDHHTQHLTSRHADGKTGRLRSSAPHPGGAATAGASTKRHARKAVHG